MKLSVITINRNNVEGLKKTIGSVLHQSVCDFEYIVVDGASTDGAVEYLKALPQDRVIWKSEPDKGIYNAMNKGVSMATGEYLLFLNSGDSFASNSVVNEINPLLDGDVDILLGRVNVVKAGEIVSTSRLLSERDMSLFNIYLQGIPHQASLIKRELLIKDPYDESLKINADWKSFFKSIIMDNANVMTIPNVIADYDGEGLSSTNMELLLEEREKAFRELMPPRIAEDYLAVFPHYYEVKRVTWLLEHPTWYKLYRALASLGIKICK